MGISFFLSVKLLRRVLTKKIQQVVDNGAASKAYVVEYQFVGLHAGRIEKEHQYCAAPGSAQKIVSIARIFRQGTDANQIRVKAVLGRVTKKCASAASNHIRTYDCEILLHKMFGQIIKVTSIAFKTMNAENAAARCRGLPDAHDHCPVRLTELK